MTTLSKLNQFGKGFQLKVLGSLLTDKKFLMNVRDTLSPEYFDTDSHKWIVKAILDYFDKYHTNITLEVLKVELQKIENEILQVAVKEELRNSYEASQEDVDYVQEEFTKFCKNQELKKALIESADLLSVGDYDSIRTRIEQALKAGLDKNLGHEYNKDIETRYRQDYRPTIPTPWPVLNKEIQGGWGPGDLAIVFGSPGGGKCVDSDTEIEIEYKKYILNLINSIGASYELTIDPWEEFNFDGIHFYGWQLHNVLNDDRCKVETVQEVMSIGDLFFNLGIYPYENNHYGVEFDLKVKTPYGYQPVDALFTTEKQHKVTSSFSNGISLSTSINHLLKSEDGEWIEIKDLKVGDKVVTEEGVTELIDSVLSDEVSVLYDMTVRDVHCYYSNGILSHNSWTMVAAAAHAVKLGYNVNYYTLELGEDYVGKRFDCYFTGKGIDEVGNYRRDVEDIMERLKGKLIVKEYAPKSASISTIKSHIQKCMDMDHRPDLVIIDYVDYLKPPSNKFRERKDEIDDVFIGAKALAKELRIPVITPSQVNRMGAKDDIIEGDKAAGSYDKMMVADICLSLSRKKEDKVLGTGRIHVMKNRYGRDGMTYNVKMDTNNGHIEIENEVDIDLVSATKSSSMNEIANKFFSGSSMFT